MKREKSLKVKWAIGLLIFLCANTLLSFIRSAQSFEGNGFSLFISFLFELLPTAAAIVLIFYDYAYTAPKRGAFSLLRMWTFGLMWVQPGLSFLSYASAGLLGTVIGYWIGSLILPLIATILLYQDAKDSYETKHENSVLKSDISNEGAEILQEQEEIKTDGQYADVATDKTPAPAPMAEQEVTPHRSSSAYIGIGFLGAGMIIGGALLKDLIGRIILMICGIALFVTAIVFSIRKVNKNSKDD